MKKYVIIGTALLALAACGKSADGVVVDGESFRGSAKRVKGDRSKFVAVGGPVSKGLEGARLAADFEAVKYCIEYLGSSDVIWTQGPDVDDSELVIEKDRVVLIGQCDEP